jgi:hypothetical protein
VSQGGSRLAVAIRSMHPALGFSSIALFLLAGVLLVAAGFDDRVIAGQNIWIKPFKFSASIAVYLVTLGLVLQFLQPIWRKRYAYLALAFMIVEIGVIMFQAMRGVPSHHNFATPFDGALYAAMGIAIILNTLMLAVMLMQMRRLRAGLQECYLLSIKLGIVFLIAGSMVGVLMSKRRAHSVGQMDAAGAVLPLLNWNLAAGDLRVPHFIGIHAIQILMFAGWFAAAAAEKRQEVLRSHRLFIYGVFVALMAVFFVTLWRAQAGLPVVDQVSKVSN